MEIKIETFDQIKFVNITHDVEVEVQKTGIKEGMCFITIPHVSAGLMISCGENSFLSKAQELLNNLVPSAPGYYRHNDVDTNAEAQLKAVLLGSGKVIPVAGGKLALEHWQNVFFVEFDGARKRSVFVTIIGK